MKPILTLGDALVEIMRTDVDQPLEAIHDFRGPFPSGAPAIFADAVGRLGLPATFIGAVGDDAFGRCITQRLARDGVDISGVRVIKDRATGAAFVMYYRDGSRQFIFHARHAASGQIDPSSVRPDTVRGAEWLHLSGTALTVSESSRAAALYAVKLAVEDGVPISFDPNIRAEMIGGRVEAFQLCSPVLEAARVILPTLREAQGLTGLEQPQEIAQVFLAMGIEQVVLKMGKRGCILFTREGQTEVSGFYVEEVDPTGAGDAFSAGYVVGLMRGMFPAEAARYANAVGALAVTCFGPMEGNPTDREVQRLL